MKRTALILTIKIIRQCLLSIAGIISAMTIHAQIPLLNSYTPAYATVYLDFDGQHVEGSIWNRQGPIDANPAGLSTNDITEIFNRVSEDYHPFNINITTDPKVYAQAPILQRVRIIITSTSNWYGNAAGASCIGSFIWGDDTPGWVFSNLLGNNPRFVAACASHEIGHTLGLQHQSLYDGNCSKITEYGGGGGTIENGWAPIMGVGYYKNCIVWETGLSAAGCDSIQNDLDVIAGPDNHFGFRADDYSDDHTKATPISIFGQGFSIKGMINHPGDKDALMININTRNELQLHAIPNNIIAKKAADLNIKISLLNANADTIARYDRLQLLYEGVDIILDAGTYYFIVEDQGKNSRYTYAKPEFYALSGSLTAADHLKQFAMGRSFKASSFLSAIQGSDIDRKMMIDANLNQLDFQTKMSIRENIIKQ